MAAKELLEIQAALFGKILRYCERRARNKERAANHEIRVETGAVMLTVFKAKDSHFGSQSEVISEHMRTLALLPGARVYG